MLALRQISAKGVPCITMNAFCASVNFEAFTRFCFSPSHDKNENSSFKRFSFPGTELGRPRAGTERLDKVKQISKLPAI